jgi:hypothetical protein
MVREEVDHKDRVLVEALCQLVMPREDLHTLLHNIAA